MIRINPRQEDDNDILVDGIFLIVIIVALFAALAL